MIQLNEMSNDKPLSRYLDSPNWEFSPLKKLADESGEQCYLEREPHYHTVPPGCWRVVHAFWHPDDEVMTRFIAYSLEGHLAYMPFGVHYDTLPKDRYDVVGYYKFKPKQSGFLLAADGSFLTSNLGGYSVQVLDKNYPSETFHFGYMQDGRQHKCLIIGFRLFMNNTG